MSIDRSAKSVPAQDMRRVSPESAAADTATFLNGELNQQKRAEWAAAHIATTAHPLRRESYMEQEDAAFDNALRDVLAIPVAPKEVLDSLLSKLNGQQLEHAEVSLIPGWSAKITLQSAADDAMLRIKMGSKSPGRASALLSLNYDGEGAYRFPDDFCDKLVLKSKSGHGAYSGSIVINQIDFTSLPSGELLLWNALR